MTDLSRRRLLTGAGLAVGGGAVVAAGAGLLRQTEQEPRSVLAADSGQSIAFHGSHQAGHRHPGAGPAALRRLRREHGRPRRVRARC